MSPILDMQVRFRELGRIRIGQQIASGNGRKRPTKLDTFRITSASRAIVDAARAAFGGTVQEWTAPAGKQWEVITKADTLDVAVMPDMALTQWNELWKGGGCERRCDGETELLSGKPCLCPADPAARRELAKNGGACKPTTRLSVMLLHPDLTDVGIYRLETHGWYGATELMGAIHLAQMSGDNMVYARLRLEQRESKKPGQPTMQYGVPVLELPNLSVGSLLGAGGTSQVGDGSRQQIPERVNRRERVPRPALPAGPPPPTETAFTHGGSAGPNVDPPPPPLPAPPPIEDEPTAVTADGEIVDGLSEDALRSWLRDHFIGLTVAMQYVRATFGDDENLTSLNDAQRAKVRAAMQEHVK